MRRAAKITLALLLVLPLFYFFFGGDVPRFFAGVYLSMFAIFAAAWSIGRVLRALFTWKPVRLRLERRRSARIARGMRALESKLPPPGPRVEPVGYRGVRIVDEEETDVEERRMKR